MTDIFLYGTVGRSFWDEDSFGASDVVEALAAADGDVTVYINSGGGLVHEGTAIYNLLRAHEGKKRVVVQGIAASIASIIAMAGDEIVMGEGAMLMIHDPAQWLIEGRGTEEDHRRVADGLATAATAMAKIYAQRSGLGMDEVRQIMKDETYFDGDEALAKGFATELAADSETEAEVAAFDYSIYAKAPPALKAYGRRIGAAASQPALVAMMAGLPAQERRPHMAETEDQTDTVAEGADEEEDMEAVETTAEVEEDGDDASSDDADDGEESPATAAQILAMTANFNLPAATAQQMIAQNMTPTQATLHIAKAVQGDNPMTGTQRRGPSRASIQRDERETQRAGMEAALIAQLGRQRDVDDNARRFMGHTLVEMAAERINYDGPLRTATDRIRAFEAAAHSTSDFPAIFENALHKRLLEAYDVAEPTFKAIASEIEFNDFREVPLVRPGDFPDLQPVGENGEIKHGTFGESKEKAVLTSYGIQVSISRKMMINDDLGAIDRVLSNYGQRIALWEDKTFYAFALAAKMANNKAMFHADHGNLAAAGTVLDVENVDAGMQAMSEQTSIDGDTLGVVPSIILTGAKQSLAAKRLIAQITPSSSAEVNPFSGDFEHVQTHRITGLEWYLLSGPGNGGNAQWVYGYLDGAEGPRTRTDEPFGSQGMAISVEHDFGVGAQDTRFGYKNPGA